MNINCDHGEKITTQFKILERSERDSTKIFARNKYSEEQKRISYMEQQLDTIRGIKAFYMSMDNAPVLTYFISFLKHL